MSLTYIYTGSVPTTLDIQLQMNFNYKPITDVLPGMSLMHG